MVATSGAIYARNNLRHISAEGKKRRYVLTRLRFGQFIAVLQALEQLIDLTSLYFDTLPCGDWCPSVGTWWINYRIMAAWGWIMWIEIMIIT